MKCKHSKQKYRSKVSEIMKALMKNKDSKRKCRSEVSEERKSLMKNKDSKHKQKCRMKLSEESKYLARNKDIHRKKKIETNSQRREEVQISSEIPSGKKKEEQIKHVRQKSMKMRSIEFKLPLNIKLNQFTTTLCK